MVRTTLSLADDVLVAAKAIASAERRTLGEVVSDLARRSLPLSTETVAMRNGLPLLTVRTPGVPVSLNVVNALRDGER